MRGHTLAHGLFGNTNLTPILGTAAAVLALLVIVGLTAGITALVVRRKDQRRIEAIERRLRNVGSARVLPAGIVCRVAEVSTRQRRSWIAVAVWAVIAIVVGFMVQYLGHPGPFSHIVRVWTWNDADWWRGLVWAGVFATIFGLIGLRDPHKWQKVLVPMDEDIPVGSVLTGEPASTR